MADLDIRIRNEEVPTEDYRCEACGRLELDCSRDPCDEVIAEREEYNLAEEECTFSKYDYSSYGCGCARCEREHYPDA
jgi:hypothetical protein